MNFKDIILYTDIDSTVAYGYGGVSTIPQNNILALKQFVKDGGLFGVASGRNHASIKALFGDITINLPYIEANGARIYDEDIGDYISITNINNSIKEVIYEFCKDKKDVHLTAMDKDSSKKIKFLDHRDEMIYDYERPLYSYQEYMEIPMLKVALVADENLIDEMIPEVDQLPYREEFTVNRSHKTYLEMFDKAASKGEAVKKVVEYKKFQNKKIVCLGDYDNDISMLEYADIAICPSNALENVKKVCDYTSLDCKEGIMSDVLEYLRRI